MSTGIGDALMNARNELGRSVEDAARVLRVRADHIHALESEQFAVFGADAYARGHLRNYAQYLGLDPAPLVQTYDRQVAKEDRTAVHMAGAPVARKPRDPLPKWMSTILITVAILTGIGVIGLIGNRAPDTSEPNDPALSASETESDVPSPTPTPTPSPTPTYEGVNLVVVLEADCWMRITVDGTPHPRSEQVFTAGDVLELQAAELVEIRYGDASAAVVQHNGSVLGTPGGSGQVITVVYGPDGPVDA